MNFKQLLKSQNFHLMSACISHRFYDNGVYQIEMVNITGTCSLIRNGDIVDTFNIHDQNISEAMLVY